MSKQPASARLATYFVPATGIDREVITTDICRYLGNDALVKPGTHKNPKGEPVQGYFITAYRALTTDQLTDIKADSARWAAERVKNQTSGRGSQGGGISPLRDSDMGVRSSNITPESYGASATRARQQPSWGETTPPQGGYAMPMPPQQPTQAGGYDYRNQPLQPQQPYGGQPDYNNGQNYSYGTTVPYGVQNPPPQPRTGFPPPNPAYGDGRGISQGYVPDNRPPPQGGYYEQAQPMPQGRGQPIPPQPQYQRDSLPGRDPYYNGRGPQEDQEMEYDYDAEFGDQPGQPQPPQPTGSGQSRHRGERDPERRADRHPAKHSRR